MQTKNETWIRASYLGWVNKNETVSLFDLVRQIDTQILQAYSTMIAMEQKGN
jgi:hypothetical protein